MLLITWRLKFSVCIQCDNESYIYLLFTLAIGTPYNTGRGTEPCVCYSGTPSRLRAL